MNKIMFAVGLIVAITSALLVAFAGTDKLGFWPMVSGIVGIGLIATSGVRVLKKRFSEVRHEQTAGDP